MGKGFVLPTHLKAHFYRIATQFDILQEAILKEQKKRKRDIPLYVWISEEEQENIRQRMEELGTQNMSAYIRKMALNGYVLNVDITPVRELVSLQRRCSNNINQVAIHANTHGIYQSEITALQKDYAELWGSISDILEQHAAVMAL